jgi:hypothetical protein
MAASIWHISSFSLLDMLRCSRGLRNITAESKSLPDAANAIVGFLYSQFANPVSKEPELALVRFYKTTSFADLDDEQQAFAQKVADGRELSPATKVLELVATAGSESEWNDPAQSAGHRAIPLLSVGMVEQAPMIAGLIKALGLDIAAVVTPTLALIQDVHGKTHNVFHVEHAPGSPLIPAQKDFVERYGIKSVIGFGGLLPTGDLFAIVMFSREHVGNDPATRFRSVSLDVKAILFPFFTPPV